MGAQLRGTDLDARTLSGEDFRKRLSMMGLDSSWHTVDQCSESAREHARSPATSLVVAERRRASEAAKVREQRAREVEAGRIDGRTASTEAVKARLQQLLGQHRDVPLIDETIRPSGEPLKRPEQVDHLALAETARRRAQIEARRAEQGGRVNAAAWTARPSTPC